MSSWYIVDINPLSEIILSDTHTFFKCKTMISQHKISNLKSWLMQLKGKQETTVRMA